MSNEEQYIINFGGKNIDKRELITYVQSLVPNWMDYQLLKGDQRIDFLNTFNDTILNIANGTWNISLYGRINGLEYQQNNEYNKYGKRLSEGERSWKGRVKFDPAYSVESLINGAANHMKPSEISTTSKSSGNKKWSNNTLSKLILDHIFGKGNAPKEWPKGIPQLENWADAFDPVNSATGERSTEGRIQDLKNNVLKPYIQDLLNGKYNISDEDKQEEITRIKDIIDNSNNSWKLGTLSTDMSHYLFTGAHYQTEEQTKAAEEQTKAAEEQTTKERGNDFLRGLNNDNPYPIGTPENALAQAIHDLAVALMELNEKKLEFNNIKSNTRFVGYSIPKEYTNIPLPDASTELSVEDLYNFMDGKVLHPEKTIRKIVNSSDKWGLILRSANNIRIFSNLYISKYILKYINDDNKIGVNRYIIPESVDWNSKSCIVIEKTAKGEYSIVKSSLGSINLSRLEKGNEKMYNDLFNQYRSNSAFYNKQGGILKFLSGTSVPTNQDIFDYWFDYTNEKGIEGSDYIDNPFANNDDLQKFYRDQFTLFYNANRTKGKEYYSNNNFSENNLKGAMFNWKGLQAFQEHLRTNGGDKGKALAYILSKSYKLKNPALSYKNKSGNIFTSNIDLTDEYIQYLSTIPEIQDKVEASRRTTDPTGSISYDLAIGVEHLLWGLMKKNSSQETPHDNGDGDNNGGGNGNGGNDDSDDNDEDGKYNPRRTSDLDRIRYFRRHIGIQPSDWQLSQLENFKLSNALLNNRNIYDIQSSIRNVHVSPPMEHYKLYTSKPLEDAIARNNAKYNEFGKFQAAGTADLGAGVAYQLASMKLADSANQPYITKQADDTRASIDMENKTAQQNWMYRHEAGEKNRQSDIALWNARQNMLAALYSKNGQIYLDNLSSRQKGLASRASYEWTKDRAMQINNHPNVVALREAYEDEKSKYNNGYYTTDTDKNASLERQRKLKLRLDDEINYQKERFDAENMAPIGQSYAHLGYYYTMNPRMNWYLSVPQMGLLQKGGKLKDKQKSMISTQDNTRVALPLQYGTPNLYDQHWLDNVNDLERLQQLRDSLLNEKYENQFSDKDRIQMYNNRIIEKILTKGIVGAVVNPVLFPFDKTTELQLSDVESKIDRIKNLSKKADGGKMLLAEQEKTRRAYEKRFHDMINRQVSHELKKDRSALAYYRKLFMLEDYYKKKFG